MIYRHIYQNESGEKIAVYSFMVYADVPTRIIQQGMILDKLELDAQDENMVTKDFIFYGMSLAVLIQRYEGVENERLSLMEQMSNNDKMKRSYEMAIKGLLQGQPAICMVEKDVFKIVQFDSYDELSINDIKKVS